MTDHHAHEGGHGHHEDSDIEIGPILKSGLGLALFLALSCVISFGVYRVLEAREARQTPPQYPLAAQQENRLPPEPRLQIHPREELRALREGEEKLLTSYGWVDRRAELVHVPVEVAMKLLVDRGIPARAEGAK